MKNDDNDKELLLAFIRGAIAYICAIIILILLCALTGCTTTKYVPVERTVLRTDTVTHYINNTDSVTAIERIYESDTRYDSVAPILDSLNRVIGWDRYHFRETTKNDSREMQRLQSLVDSLKAVKRDSVEKQVPYPVERKLTKWERIKQDARGMAIGVAIFALCVAVVWLIRKFRK